MSRDLKKTWKTHNDKKVKKAAKSHVTVHQKTIKMAKLCVRVSRDFDRKEMQKNFSKAQNKMAAKKIT